MAQNLFEILKHFSLIMLKFCVLVHIVEDLSQFGALKLRKASSLGHID